MSEDARALSPLPRSARRDLSRFDVPHPDPFVCQLTIDRQHLSGAIEHVSNVEYLRWLDCAAELHADHVGYTRRRMLDRGIMWFVARHEIDYLAEAWPDDMLVVATWVRDMQRVKSWRDYVVVRPSDDTLVCRAATLWVLIDLATRRPTRVPADMARQFDPLHQPRATQRCTSD
ncbi:MAG: acyl-CoA thioesterase [Planctomycetota bacterium]